VYSLLCGFEFHKNMNSFIRMTDYHYLCTTVPCHYTLTAKTKFQISLIAEPIVTVYFMILCNRKI
jgi:hypothetical protein